MYTAEHRTVCTTLWVTGYGTMAAASAVAGMMKLAKLCRSQCTGSERGLGDDRGNLLQLEVLKALDRTSGALLRERKRALLDVFVALGVAAVPAVLDHVLDQLQPKVPGVALKRPERLGQASAGDGGGEENTQREKMKEKREREERE